MKGFVIFSMCLLMAMLSACDKKEETRSVEWYLQPENKSEWEAKLEQCKSNPGELRNSPNCINARKAFDRQFIRGGETRQIVEPEFGFGKK